MADASGTAGAADLGLFAPARPATQTGASAPPQKPKPQRPKVMLTEAQTKEESTKRAGRRRRAKEEKLPPPPMEDERTRIAQAAAQAAMIMMGMQPAPTMNVAPTQAASSNASAARPPFVLDARTRTASPAPTYGYLPGRDPTPPPFFSLDVEDSSPPRTTGSIDLNTAPLSGLSTAPSSKGGHRAPMAVLPVPRNLFGEMLDPSTQPTPVQTREEGEGFMANMINEDGQASYIDVGDEVYEEEGDEVEGSDDAHIDDMPLFMDELTQQAKAARKNMEGEG